RNARTLKEVVAASGRLAGRGRSAVSPRGGSHGTGRRRRSPLGHLGEFFPRRNDGKDGPLQKQDRDPDARQFPWWTSVSVLVATLALASAQSRLAPRCGMESEISVA